MKRNVTFLLSPLALFAFAFTLILSPMHAHAGEALPELKGAWLAEKMDGNPPPPGVKMVMTFVDDAELKMEVTFQGETQLETVKYKATKDGSITIYPEPETNPEGESAKWEIKEKKLHLTTAEGESLIFKRPE